MPDEPLHPKQLRMDVTLTNGVRNAVIVTLHRGDYTFVEDIAIEGVKVGWVELTDEEIERRQSCVKHESGHKVPASTIRKLDGRLIGSCEKCYERVNIARFPGTEDVADVSGLLQSVLWESTVPTGVFLGRIHTLERRILEDQRAIDRALNDLRRAKAVIVGRAIRRRSDG